MRDSGSREPFTTALFSEIFMIDQLVRTRLGRALPRGMELLHFMVLNHLSRTGGEKTPAWLARVLIVTKGAMTNSLQKLNAAGYVHIRPDWDDARRKLVGLSDSGRTARDDAVRAMAPAIEEMVNRVDTGLLRRILPLLHELRASIHLSD